MTSFNVTNVRRERVRLPLGTRVHTQDGTLYGTVVGYGEGYDVEVKRAYGDSFGRDYVRPCDSRTLVEGWDA